mmetsp:Transcript_6109/g.10337  ORF Transcript_6109/g.10337 Transcript_6109/m.10337 type:complete len:287 (+) Transcript_6109:63-923(+)
MPILAVTAAKIRADSPLGFSYKFEPNEGIFITNVSRDGLFCETHLKAGQQIISINGTDVKTVDTNTFKAVLASLPAGDVTIVIRTHEEHNICSVTFNCVCNHVINRQDGSIQRMIRSKMQTSVDIIPETLILADVPRDVWLLIYALIEEELMPVSLACFREKEEYAKEMFKYYRNVGKTSQKTADMKGVHTGILHNNVTLVATALKDRVNSILAKYNIMSAIATKEFELPKYPNQTSPNKLMLAVGLKFYPMNFETVSAVAVPISATSVTLCGSDEDVVSMSFAGS